MAITAFSAPPVVSPGDKLNINYANNAIRVSLVHLRDVNQSWCQLRYIAPNGVGGGTALANNWVRRPLNQHLGNAANFVGLDVGSSRFTLQPGVWHLRAAAATHYSGDSKLRLYNVSDGMVQDISMSGGVSSLSALPLILETRFGIASSKVFQLELWCSKTQEVTGMGKPSNSGQNELYTLITLDLEGGYSG